MINIQLKLLFKITPRIVSNKSIIITNIKNYLFFVFCIAFTIIFNIKLFKPHDNFYFFFLKKYLEFNTIYINYYTFKF